MLINVPPHHGEFSGVFLKLINIYIVTESLVFILTTLDIIKLEKKKYDRNSL